MKHLTGTGRLLLFGFRRERIMLPAWLVAIAGLAAISVASVQGIYTTAGEREAAAAFMAGNRLSRAFDGPVSGTSIGNLAITETFLVLAVLTALMSILTVARHTRQDDETGRGELLGSAPIGRHARLAAAVIVAGAANVLLAALTAISLVVLDLPLTGAIAAGLALGGVGLSFAAVAAITVQLSDTNRGAISIAAVVVGAAFLLRAIGDAAGTVAPTGDRVISAWPSWLSPIGWGQQVRPFSDDRWEILPLFLAFTAALVTAAFVLNSRRDVNSAFIRTRPGPPAANRALLSPLGLAWRLQRGTALAWAVVIVVFASAFGSLGEGAEDLAGLSAELEAALRALAGNGTLLDAYFAFVMSFIGIAVAGFTIQSLLRARGEEAGGRLEPILAAAVGRVRWLSASVALAALITVLLVLLAGFAAGVAYGVATGEFATGIRSFSVAAAVQLPAALVLGGLVIAVFGMAPRLAMIVGWTALALSLVAGQLGDLLDLPDVVLNLSPFTHVPAAPAEPVTAAPILGLLGVALALTALGATAFRRRDIHA